MSSQEPVTLQKTPKGVFVDALLKKFEKLSDTDRNLFSYGPLYLGGNAAFAGLIANSLFRRALNVTQGRIVSSLPMATLPFLTTVALYNATVSNPLILGDLNCPTCAVIRGAMVGVVGGGVYPLLLALPVNAGLAARYNTAPMPEKGNVMRFWMIVGRPIARKMAFVFVLQGFFGTYLASKHFDIYVKLLKLVDMDHEDLHD
ncbi:transmembrane protein 126A [Alosa sapidissima]|uniref:transmembrane protein 126A n=1 Tax=Alosa sapidissima TaxID=34773 RepID=UPI001C09661B|nr:transmembrane protein 126A [Alosa sapidissima]